MPTPAASTAPPVHTLPAAPRAAGQGIDARLLPEHPKLAPGVKLAGEMKESAFENPPWLIEREDAGYVQVTDLLYRIAELSTGSNTVEGIASKISADGKPVNSTTVQSLIAQLLIPRGLVEMADGSVAPLASAASSPLALNMRMKMIRPESVMPVTRLLKVLYWPPFLVVILVVAALAEGWVYFVHGVGGGLHDTLYSPGLMVIVLVVVVASAAFHELGHATALHYAGGRIKGMGAGMYIVYPAFFTDVSDNYRLPRWSRVRTDLGGFYFNLIFALGILGLFLLTGHEFLLLMVLMINLEIVHQLMPFLRLDGYWTLADITGVPDFFSQMTAFVRSVLPGNRWKGRKLPALKWWGKAVFALYMLITIPLLLLLLLIMIRSVPRVFATAWDSMGQQGQTLLAAQGNGDGLGILGAAAQAVLLLIPTLGLGYTLFSLGRRLSVGLWNWGKPNLARRAVSGMGLVGCAGLLGFMWVPQVSLPGQPAGSPTVAGPLTQANWEPIRAQERGTLIDAVGGVVATREPAARVESMSTPQPAVPVEGTPGPSPRPVQPFTDIQTNPTSSTPAIAATTPVPTPGAQGLASPVPRGATAPPAQTRAVVQATSVSASTPGARTATPTPVR